MSRTNSKLQTGGAAGVLIPTICPRPIRFDNKDDAMLRQLKQFTGLSISSLIRRSVQYAAPRFLDGRVNLLTLKDEPRGVPLALALREDNQ